MVFILGTSILNNHHIAQEMQMRGKSKWNQGAWGLSFLPEPKGRRYMGGCQNYDPLFGYPEY